MSISEGGKKQRLQFERQQTHSVGLRKRTELIKEKKNISQMKKAPIEKVIDFLMCTLCEMRSGRNEHIIFVI